MYTKSEILDAVTERYNWIYDKENDSVIFEDGTNVPADITVKHFREKIGQSFKCIYDEHVSLQSVLQCTKCGTVIFSSDDEYYEHNLKCPTCTDYKTGFQYWTKENIEKDEEKQEAIKFYEHMREAQIKADERYRKRGNLYDYQKTHKKILFKNNKWVIDIQLTGLRKWDLKAEINMWKHNTCKHYIQIPISPYTIWFFIKHKIKMKVTWENV